VTGLLILVAMICAFFAGRAAETMAASLPPPEPTTPQLPGGPYRQLALPPVAAQEAVLLVRDLREAVNHFKAVADETLAALEDMEREVQEHARRAS
jgi:hypothetical protein